MTTNQAAELAKKKDAGTITPEERTQLAAWINNATDKEYDDFYFACYQYLESSEAAEEQSYNPGADKVVQYLDKHIKPAEMQAPVITMYRQHKTRWNAAAVFMLCVLGAYLWMGRRSGQMVPEAVAFDTASAQQNFFGISARERTDALDTIHKHTTEVYTRIIRFDSLTLQAIKRSADGATERVVDVSATISVPTGMHYVVNMPDGSRIWLNTLSTLTVAPGYGHRSRSMELKGEGYFEVNQDADEPFIVRGGVATVQVLGTSFNMNCYEDESVQKITLVQGKISVKDNNFTIQLKEKEQVVISSGTPVTSVVDTDEVLSWKKGYIDFKDANLIDIFRTLERWYGIKINYLGMRPMQTYSCRLSKNMNPAYIEYMLMGSRLKGSLKGKILTVQPV